MPPVSLSTAFSQGPLASLPGQIFSHGPLEVAFSHGPLPLRPPKTFSHGALAVTVSHGPLAVNASHGAWGVLEPEDFDDVLGEAPDATEVVVPDVGGLHGLEQLTVLLGSARAGAAKASGAAISATPIAVRRSRIPNSVVFAREGEAAEGVVC